MTRPKTPGTPGIRQVTAADIDAVALTLAKAFEDDPVKLFLTGGKSLAPERTTPFFTAFQRIQLPHGLVFTTPGLEAASIWAPPGEWKIPITKIVRHSPAFLKLYGVRFFSNLGVLADMEKLHPTEPHYYLEVIGTDPAHQGKGFGSKLMGPILDRADREGVGAYLESSKESNVSFYSRFGFEVTQELHHRRNGPTMWLMWRDPR
jgi:ribosomal protein S18 acetylase RimI-like enzyme